MKIKKRTVSLREARILNGLTLNEAADRLGIPSTELGNYENDPSSIYVSMAIKIAGLYKVGIDYLDFTSHPLHNIV
jgi:transcriptional regulator with XRE-family HTH domain